MDSKETSYISAIGEYAVICLLVPIVVLSIVWGWWLYRKSSICACGHYKYIHDNDGECNIMDRIDDDGNHHSSDPCECKGWRKNDRLLWTGNRFVARSKEG